MSSNHSDEINLLAELVKIESINKHLVPDSKGVTEISEYIKEHLDNLGLETSIQRVDNERQNTIGILRGTGKGNKLILNGHMDTVGTHFMTIDPLKPEIKDGKLYGRGSCDMKSGIAAQLTAIKHIVEQGIKLKGDIIFTAVCDEEYSQKGTTKVLEEYSGDAAIVGEPSRLQLKIAQKGFVGFNVTTKGNAIHTARWYDGVDAITKMGKILVEYDKIDNKLKETPHHLTGPGSVHASIIKGGQEISSYPEECLASFVRWFTPGLTIEDMHAELESLLSSIGEVDPEFTASYEQILARSSHELSTDSPFCRLFSRVLLDAGVEPVFSAGFAWDESGLFAEKGIPVVSFGPKGEGAHGNVEWVDVDSVKVATQVYESIIREFCGVND